MTNEILVVEDDSSILLGLHINLRNAGYKVRIAKTGREAIQELEKKIPDLLLLDLMLPEVNGLEVLRHLRSMDKKAAVVILTSLASEADKIAGLDLGANDYVTKPFSVAELLARVRAAIRTTNAGTELEEVRRAGSLELRCEARTVHMDGKLLDLSSKEYELLLFFMERPERVITREQILANIWGDEYSGTMRTVDNYISSLRRKLGEGERARLVQTVRGIGYRFVP